MRSLLPSRTPLRHWPARKQSRQSPKPLETTNRNALNIASQMEGGKQIKQWFKGTGDFLESPKYR
ncbi:hypothetical protein SAMN05192539_104135 [Paraburkholderia diazotrophica]|uniref:Uncharacterized protein n=1 Tax=Paraburkholderia diazotrophica TaxID=667676 RepID=A0A1H7E3H8_9BURK|nr:hypothetical protein SAMN05192539_104135 [Paraburkholderia diazotrophica]